jgi:hypothetical protein
MGGGGFITGRFGMGGFITGANGSRVAGLRTQRPARRGSPFRRSMFEAKLTMDSKGTQYYVKVK